MKKLLLSIVFLACIVYFSSCSKNAYVTTPNPYMNATVGPYIFNTTTVYPATKYDIYNDTTETLYITGEQLQTKEKIILSITYYKGQAGVFSIDQKHATAKYIHSTGTGIALGGIVAITKFTDDSIIGYFNFDTNDTLTISYGTFSVPKPYYVAHP